MITFKSRNGRLGEVMNLIYGLFYFCIRNDIPLENIVINKNYTGQAWDNDKLDYVIRDNFPIFENIKSYIRDIDNYDEFLSDNDFHEFECVNRIFLKPQSIDLSQNLILSNYWHFPYNKKLFHALFKPYALVNRLKDKYKDIDFTKACSCHIRRGDFQFIKDNPKLLAQYKDKVPPSVSEIRNKICHFHEQYPDYKVLVMSDDIKWCKQNLNVGKYIQYIEGNKPYEDISLIGMCDKHLQFNSSYFNLVGIMLGD